MIKKTDIIVIGNGPAGISCAIYLKRFNLNPIVIGNGYGSLEKATIENYYGIESITGKDLIDLGIKQAKNLGIEVINTEVLSIEQEEKFKIITPIGKYDCDAVFLGIGMPRQKIKLPRLEEFEGKGISYCAICDGFFYKQKNIGIIGSGDYMLSELATLERFTSNITIFTDGVSLENKDHLVVTDKLTKIIGNDKFEGLSTDNNDYKLDGLFIANGSASPISFSRHLGLATDKLNYLVVNEDYMTNIPGIFAGGDVIGGLLQVSKAVADGAIAANKIKEYLKNKL